MLPISAGIGGGTNLKRQNPEIPNEIERMPEIKFPRFLKRAMRMGTSRQLTESS